MQTFSKKCQEELSKELNIIYPWTCKNKNLNIVQYDGLLTDIKTYWNEEPRYREGFELTDNSVTIPIFFTRINGIYNKKKDQEKLEKIFTSSSIYYESIKSFEKTIELNIKRISLDSLKLLELKFGENIYENLKYLNKEGLFEKLFFELSPFIREQCLEKVKLFEEKYEKTFQIKMKDFYLFLIFLDKRYVDALNNFDYPFHNPKIVIKENENELFTETDIMFLTFLAFIGFDILILNPYGKTDINTYININDIHLDKTKQVKESTVKKQKKRKKQIITKENILLVLSFLFLILPFLFLNGYNIENHNFIEAVLIGIIFSDIFLLVSSIDTDFTKFNKKILSFCLGIISFILAFSTLMFIVSDIESIYLEKEGELKVEKEVLVNEENDFYFEIGKKAYLDENTGDLFLYLGNPPKNDKKLLIDIFYEKQEILLNKEISNFSYYITSKTDSEFKKGTYKFTIKGFTNEGIFGKKTLQFEKEIEVNCISHKEFLNIIEKDLQ